MDIKDLKKTWDKISSGKELNENQLREMLGKRTKSLIERIDRNIKIGFVLLLVLIVLFSIDDLWFSPQILEEYYNNMPIPNWVIFLAVLGNVLILTTFVYFVVSYYRVKRNCDVACNLQDTLKQIIGTLVLYQRLFYLALATILLAMGSAFVTGMIKGTVYYSQNRGVETSDIAFEQWGLVILVIFLFLSIVGGGMFLILRWGFRKLYGNYINKLKDTLQELEEIE